MALILDDSLGIPRAGLGYPETWVYKLGHETSYEVV